MTLYMKVLLGIEIDLHRHINGHHFLHRKSKKKKKKKTEIYQTKNFFIVVNPCYLSRKNLHNEYDPFHLIWNLIMEHDFYCFDLASFTFLVRVYIGAIT